MKSLKFYVLLISQVILFNNLFAEQKKDTVSAEKIINNAISAMGGKEYLQSVNTLYTAMSTEMEGRQVQWIVKEMKPGKGAFQIIYNNRIVYQNWFNGEEGFEIVNGKKEKADPEEFKDKKFMKNIFDELDYLDTSLWKLQLIGEERVSGEDCYKIKATLVDGLVKLLYFSKASFYMLRSDKVQNKEKDSFTTSLYSGYKKFGRLTYYSEMQVGEGDQAQTVKITDLLVNEKVTEDDFK